MARELGRKLVLTGKRTPSGLEGTATETITGLRTAPVQVAGAFTFHRHAPSPASSSASTTSPRMPRHPPGSRHPPSTPKPATTSAPP